MIKKVLAYLKKNNVIYNRINDREYNIKFPEERSVKELTTKELLLKFMARVEFFMGEQREFNSKANNFMTEQLKFNNEQLKFNNLLLSLPTIKKEISESAK